MALIKVKHRPSTQEGKEGTVYYQVIQNRVIRQIKTDYRIFADEWDNESSALETCNIKNIERKNYLDMLREYISRDIKSLEKITDRLMIEGNCTADKIVDMFIRSINEQSFSQFMETTISQLKRLNKVRTAENYAATLSSFMRFRKENDIYIDDISADLMMEYEAYLKVNDISMNTVSFYMRILRAAYNRAVEKNLVTQCYPFKHVYTGIDKTVKRAIPLKAIKQIKGLNLSLKPSLDFARDMFLFSFYTRGMSFIDMAFLDGRNLQNGILSYRRRKTGQQLLIKWEKNMQEIIDKYSLSGVGYLLPILKTVGNERRQYQNTLRLVNNKLKEISTMAKLDTNLTMYVARHSWASIAKSKNIPISVISEGMGHDSEATTQIYLASLDRSIIDKANEMILRNL